MVDYSKWDHIEISDDEDDTHPNVDTPSLFRWRHQARLDKEKDRKDEDAKKNAQSKLRINKIDELTAKIKKFELDGDKEEQLKGLRKEVEELTKEEKDFQKKEEELRKYEEAHPQWNVDNMSEDKHNRTIINKAKQETGQNTELGDYFQKYGDECKAFGFLSKYEESHKYLKSHMHLVCEHLGSYLVIWAVDLCCEDKHELKERVAHQAIIAQYIMELARTLKQDPRACIDPFFKRVSTAEAQYMKAFDDEYQALLKRIDDRKEARFQEAKEKLEEEEKQERIKQSPSGKLDPLEVLESLPEKMKKAFKEQDTPRLKESFAELSPEDMNKYYKLVVESGLWVPAPEDQPTETTE